MSSRVTLKQWRSQKFWLGGAQMEKSLTLVC